jgi:preprotein translocase subunit YajC
MSLINVLTAQSGQAPAGSGILVILIYVVIFGLMIYFMAVKPQKKQQAKHQEMMTNLKPGCSIMTTSGFFGTVIDIPDDETVIVEFGNNKNCRIPMHKKAIAEIEDPDSVTE